MEMTNLTSKSVTCSDALTHRTVTCLERVQAAATVLSTLLRCKQMVTPPGLISFLLAKALSICLMSRMCRFIHSFKILSPLRC